MSMTVTMSIAVTEIVSRVLSRKCVEISVGGAGICITLSLIYTTMTKVRITIKIS